MRSTFKVLFYVKKGSAKPNGNLPLMCRITVSTESNIRQPERSYIEVYNLETIAALAFRVESFGAAKVRKALLERIMHGRKEKATVFVPLFTSCISEKHWQA